jgi:HAE1 family hydrophobic/amphiphilic exporter-1/multidrug efflux pump
MFTNFFVKRPVFASVCSLLIVLVGLVSYVTLPVREFPNIDPPVVSVTTVFPGANPLLVETEVTEVLEEEINGVEGIKTLSSDSREGVSAITVQFELDRDPDVAAQDVRARVSRAVGDLPDEAEAPIVSKQSADASPILWLALYGENFTTLELSEYADRNVTDALETVSGVSNVIIGGERRYAMRLWIDPQRLAARNLTVLDLEQALRTENVEIPSGRIEAERSEFSVRTLGRLETPEEYESLVVKRNDDGTQVTFAEIGYAEVGAESERSFVRYNGQPAVGLGVVKITGSNTLAVADGAKERIRQLSENFPAGMQYAVASDDSEFVQQAIDGVWESLFFAIVLVIVVIFLFLQDWRSTLIPAITIPVALIGAFAIMNFGGFSINTLTLFALTLATGLVVDDTIVVLENIVRYLEEKNHTAFRAAMEGVSEVVFAVIATTLVLVAVFLPIGFATGTTGRLFTEFSITLAGSVLFSSFVALTLAPAMSARLLRREKSAGIPGLGWLLDRLNRGINGARDAYRWSLERMMSLKGIIVGVFFLSIAVAFVAFRALPLEFLPTEDRGSIFTVVNAPEGVTIDYTSEVMRQVEQVYSQVPEVQSYFTVGALAQQGPGQVNEGLAFVELEPWSERTEPGQSQQAIIGQLFGRFSQITDAFVLPINPSALPGAGFSQPVQFVLQGSNLENLAEVSGELANRARQLPELVNIDTDLRLNKPELTLTIDRRRAADLGVSVRDVSRTLQILLGGEEITEYSEGNQLYEVVVQAQDSFRRSPEDINQLYVRSSSGEMVPLSNLVTVTSSTIPPSISHFNRARAATIQGSPAPGVSLGQALDALRNAAQEILPDDIRTALAGTSLEFQESGQATFYIFGLALVFIFLVLAAQFESYLDPLVILLAVPLSLLGAFGALFLRGLNLNVYSQIGVIMLIGLATKNSILIVEFANQLRDLGESTKKAAIDAGTIRFRPILMTAFSTIFGLMPLALSSGAGAASRISLGTAVVGGMLVATFLSLYVVPVFYVLAEMAVARLFGRHRQEAQ